ncbi:MAG: hypothetical protein Q7J34_09570 [Bacteroidales bacterium]|nr:hypothetical protein [Bacteroidales bacterium]
MELISPRFTATHIAKPHEPVPIHREATAQTKNYKRVFLAHTPAVI